MSLNHEVFIANNGSLPASTWARITSNRILSLIDIGDNTQGFVQKAKFEADLIAIFAVQHTAVQQREHSLLEERQYDRLSEPFDPHENVELTVKEVVAVTTGTLFEAHFLNPEVQDVLRVMIGSDFSTQMDIERGWFASQDRSHPKASEYFARKGQ